MALTGNATDAKIELDAALLGVHLAHSRLSCVAQVPRRHPAAIQREAEVLVPCARARARNDELDEEAAHPNHCDINPRLAAVHQSKSELHDRVREAARSKASAI